MGKGVMMAKEKTDALVEHATQSQPEASRGVGGVTLRMVLATGPGESKLEWNLKAKSMVEMVTQGKKICKDAGKKWPQDVIVWGK